MRTFPAGRAGSTLSSRRAAERDRGRAGKTAGLVAGVFVSVVLILPSSAAAGEEGATFVQGGPPEVFPTRGVSLTKSVMVPGPPAAAWDAFTGDVSGWWDHHFSPDPEELVIDRFPGGTFHEIFDEEGNGAIHAEVLYADRPGLLRLRGPFGFSGYALDLVHTLRFEAEGDSTKVTLEILGAGQLQDDWPAALSNVWDHFLGRYRDWVVGGAGG